MDPPIFLANVTAIPQEKAGRNLNKVSRVQVMTTPKVNYAHISCLCIETSLKLGMFLLKLLYPRPYSFKLVIKRNVAKYGPRQCIYGHKVE